MTDKQLKNKAVDIKGKKYVLVADRVLYFNEEYPSGSIVTKLISPFDSETVVIRASVTPDCNMPDRQFTGYSQAKWGDGYINKTSALENAETSAVGRALAMMGIGVIESIASIDEINKANNQKFVGVKEIRAMREAAKNVTGFDNAEEIDDWIEEIVGMRPNKVFLTASSGAIRKIYAKKSRETPTPEERIHEVGQDIVITELPDNINLDDIPY